MMKLIVELNYETERKTLAAVFRMIALFDMHESIANHCSLQVSDNQFLVNPNGRHFSQITASELLLLKDNNPNDIHSDKAPDKTAWAIHSAIHREHDFAQCILHVHSKYATVLASLQDSTMYPIDQNTMRFYERVAIDVGFTGMGLGEEACRLSSLLEKDKPILLMGNHGVLVVADTVAQAFDDLYYFERSCETLITAYSTGQPLRIVNHDIAKKTAQQWLEYEGFAEKHFDEILKTLDKTQPDYMD